MKKEKVVDSNGEEKEVSWDEKTQHNFFGEVVDLGSPSEKSTSLEENEAKDKVLEGWSFGQQISEEDDSEGEEDSGEDTESATEEEDSIEEEDDSEEDTGSPDYIHYLKSRGLLDIDVEEGAELSVEEEDELIQDAFETKVEKTIEDLLKGLPSQVRELNEFVLAGGDPNKFIAELSNSAGGSSIKDLDLSKEENMKLVIAQSLKDDDYDDEYIEDHIANLVDNGHLEKVSKKIQDKVVAKEQQATTQMLERQRENKRLAKQKVRESKVEVSQLMDKSSELFGLPISEKDRKSLPSYLLDKSLVTKSGVEVSQFSVDLNKALEDPTKAAILGQLIRSGFDFSAIEKKGGTKEARKMKSDMRRTKRSPRTGSKRQDNSNLTLIEKLRAGQK